MRLSKHCVETRRGVETVSTRRVSTRRSFYEAEDDNGGGRQAQGSRGPIEIRIGMSSFGRAPQTPILTALAVRSCSRPTLGSISRLASCPHPLSLQRRLAGQRPCARPCSHPQRTQLPRCVPGNDEHIAQPKPHETQHDHCFIPSRQLHDPSCILSRPRHHTMSSSSTAAPSATSSLAAASSSAVGTIKVSGNLKVGLWILPLAKPKF